jgi:hypothetical protein
MGSPLLEVSPLATFLLELAARKATGRLVLAGRTLELVAGAVADVIGAAHDESLEEFLVKAGRVSESVLAQYEHSAASEHTSAVQLLVRDGALREIELRQARRALWVDRLARGLRVASERGGALPMFTAITARTLGPGTELPLTSLLLDALARAAASADAGVVGANLNYRLDWAVGAHEHAAREWADFGEAPQRPAVSTILAKRPAAAARIAALLRSGLVRLDPPGVVVPSHPPPARSLPEPLPRLAAIPSQAGSIRPIARDPIATLASVRPPRLRLDPGQAQASAEALEPTLLPMLPRPSIALDDALLPIEQRIAELEARGASGAERARAFCALADVWRNRLGSLERACRAYREAAAADPSDPAVLQQAALHCHHLGQSELAVRYAVGAVLAAGTPIERAAAQRLRAGIERAAGNIERCIEALCEAAADDPGDPTPHEQVAALLLEQGNVEGANAHARLASTAFLDHEKQRALSLLAWAWSLQPFDAPTAYEYSSALDEGGRRLGAVAILASTASRSSDPNQRRKLRLAAAERAEAAQRPDLAAELLVDAFDAEPHFDLLYGPLDEDLAAIDFCEYRAVMLEDIATVCADEHRAYWLALAGQVMLQAEQQHEAGLWLLLEALLTDPKRRESLSLLREHARSDRELLLLAHGLRAAIAACIDHDRSAASALLRELAELAETGLASIQLALDAWQQLSALCSERQPDIEAALVRLGERARELTAELEATERALGQSQGDSRGELCCHLAELLADLPEHRPRKIQLLSLAILTGAATAKARATLETLHGLNRDAVALATFLEDQAELSQDRTERARLLCRLCAVHTLREDTPALAAACESLLAIDPGNRVAIARLLRAARKLGDPRRLARALCLRLAIAGNAAERGRTLAQLARAEELAGLFPEAARHAAQAILEDGSAVDAGLILVRHTQRVEPATALGGLQALRKACGASPALLATEAQLAEACGDWDALGHAIDLWLELFPRDAEARTADVLLRAQGDDSQALLEAASAALALCPCATVLDAARSAVDRLEALLAPDAACRLALRIAQEQGRMDPALALRALALARGSHDPDLVTAALELACVVAAASERNAVLFELAAHHHAHAAHAAEVRALLRVLEEGERHILALVRLRELFALGDDGPRLLAVVTLMLEGEDDPSKQRALLLELAVIARERLNDLDRAEHYVRMLVAQSVENEAEVRVALGALLALGETRWALERCQAIADGCPPLLASRIYLFCAVTAEQRCGDPGLALEIASKAALRWPQHAEPLLVVERLTLATNDASAALRTYDALIAVASGPHGRRALLYRAGRWLERAGLLDLALERYEQAFELAPTTGAAFKALSRVARQIGKLDHVIPCYERLAEHIREGRARFSLLSTAGELCLHELGDGRRGLQLLLRANELSERFELDDRVLEASRRLVEREPEAAIEALEGFTAQLTERAAQLWSGEDKVRCLVQLASVCSADLGRHAQALAQIDEALAIAQREGLAPSFEADARDARSAVLARGGQALEPSAVPDTSREPPEPTTDEASMATINVASATDTSRDERDELRRLINAEPWRTDVLRSLHEGRPDLENSAEHHVLRQLVSTFEPSVEPASDIRFPFALWHGGELREAIGSDGPKELERLLSMLWECSRVIRRFRNPQAGLGISERDRISRITVGPVADAYAQAARALGRTDVAVYIMLADGASARAVATHPPVVLASRGMAQDETALLYEMAHALWLAKPEHMVGGVLSPEDAGDLLRAAQLAFDPALTRSSASSTAKELAAALWQSMPMREQRLMSEAIRSRQSELSYEVQRARTRASAARAALRTSGGLRAALLTLPKLETELGGLDLSNESDFALGCKRSAALGETVRCALSRVYLDALARAL